jgi:hypothetical protein
VLWTDQAGEPLRGAVRAAIEEASGQALSVADALPDELIAVAQIEGIPLGTLQVWIYGAKGADGWSAPAFARWARAVEVRRREIALRMLAGAAARP